jgi:hypothetical protein
VTMLSNSCILKAHQSPSDYYICWVEMKAYWKHYNHQQQKENVSKSSMRRYRAAYPNCSMKN